MRHWTIQAAVSPEQAVLLWLQEARIGISSRCPRTRGAEGTWRFEALDSVEIDGHYPAEVELGRTIGQVGRECQAGLAADITGGRRTGSNRWRGYTH